MSAIDTYLPSLLDLVHAASQQVLAIYDRHEPLVVHQKVDHTPLTEADLVAHHVLTEGIKQLTPQVPVVSEESLMVPYALRQSWQNFWLIDPLDGTKDFIAKTGDFAINVAFIENQIPIFGLIHLPVTNVTYYAYRYGKAIKRFSTGKEIEIQTRPLVPQKATVAVSRHAVLSGKRPDFLKPLNIVAHLTRGSSLKFCLIAEGLADVYPRLGPTSEWDTAAGQCILEAAGGSVINLNGEALRYNTHQTFLNPSFLAIGDNVDFWRQSFN